MNSSTDLTNRAQNAFTFAQEVVKQQITLSTAIFAITLTFLKDVLPKGIDTTLLEVAWAAYLSSVLFGLLTLMSLAGVLGSSTSDDIFSPGVRLFAGIQALLFFAALILTLVFGFKVV